MNRHVLLGMVLVGAGFISGYLFRSFSPSATQLFSASETRLGGYKLINPLLFCDTQQQSPNPQVANVKKVLEDEITRSFPRQKVSVYYRDLNNGPWFGINENEPFSPASLLKVPILIAAYKQADSDPEFLVRQHEYIPSADPTTPAQNLLPAQTLVPRNKYTVEELLYRMIVYSDNESANVLKQILGQDRIISVYTGLGINLPNNDFDDFLSTRAYTSVYRVLYNASFLNTTQSQKALLLLTQTQFRNGLVEHLPQEITVAHKFGERETPASVQVHDCGIIYHPRHPYTLCVMTKGDNYNEQVKAISALSQLVFEGVSSFAAK